MIYNPKTTVPLMVAYMSHGHLMLFKCDVAVDRLRLKLQTTGECTCVCMCVCPVSAKFAPSDADRALSLSPSLPTSPTS